MGPDVIPVMTGSLILLFTDIKEDCTALYESKQRGSHKKTDGFCESHGLHMKIVDTKKVK